MNAESGERSAALDGLRGIACLAVILHHCRVATPAVGWGRSFDALAAAGWAGVDVFFVLSGFLITRLLLEAREGSGLGRFWGRRALRILPLAFVYLGIIFYTPLYRDEAWHPVVVSAQGWFWTYTNNILTVLRPDFDAGLITHFWSLAIEEQFYLVWPAVIWFVPQRHLRLVCVLVVVTSVGGRAAAVFSGVWPPRVFVLTPLHLDGLALGALLALPGSRAAVPVVRLAWTAALFFLLGLVLLTGGLRAEDPWVFVLGIAAVSACTALLILALRDEVLGAPVRRLFELPSLVWAGRVSYGAYILHVPLIAFLREAGFRPGPSLAERLVDFVVVAGLTVSVATLVWFGFERPFLRLRERLWPQPTHK